MEWIGIRKELKLEIGAELKRYTENTRNSTQWREPIERDPCSYG